MVGYVTGACYFCLAHADQVDWVWSHEALIINHVVLRLRAEPGMERE